MLKATSLEDTFFEEYICKGIEGVQEKKILEWLFKTVSPQNAMSLEATKLLSDYLGISDLINSETHYGDIAITLEKEESSILRSLCFLENFVNKTPHLPAHTSNLLLKFCRKGPLLLEPELRLLCTDSDLNITFYKTIQKGSVDPTSIEVSYLLQILLAREAYGFFLVANKFKENPTPSQAEINLSTAIRNGMSSFNIDFHDYILYGKDTHYSFRTNHYI